MKIKEQKLFDHYKKIQTAEFGTFIKAKETIKDRFALPDIKQDTVMMVLSSDSTELTVQYISEEGVMELNAILHCNFVDLEFI